MNELEIFKNEEFGEVRTMMINEQPYFCGRDIAQALGYARPAKAIQDHCRGILKRDIGVVTGVKSDGSKAEQIVGTNFIPEGDVYRLIIKSKLPSAEKFESWVMEEVLPSIRKHGAYMTESTLEKALTSPDFLIKLATQLKEEQAARKLAEQKIEEQKPLVDFASKVSDSSNLIDMKQMAKLLYDEHIDIGRNKLFKWLRNNDILMDNNEPYQRYIKSGYFEVKESTFSTPYGVKTSITTYVTGKGQIWITEKLRKELDIKSN